MGLSEKTFPISWQKIIANNARGMNLFLVEEAKAQGLESSPIPVVAVARRALEEWFANGTLNLPFLFSTNGITRWAFMRNFSRDFPDSLAGVIPQQDLVARSTLQNDYFVLLILFVRWSATLVFSVTFLRRGKKRYLWCGTASPPGRYF